MSNEAGGTAVATFGAGCFWGVQARFDEVGGVLETVVGYQGGRTERPSYEEVCRDDTGHAEVVRVVYDPGAVSFEVLLDVFFGLHDPTQKDRQGPDVGRQYRSAVFVTGAAERAAVEAKIASLTAAGRFGGREIVTSIEEASSFWAAEDYHQKYLEKRGASSCRVPGLG